MNVIQRICEKYQIEYNLMPDFRMRTVSLTFGPQVPGDLQNKILEGLDWLGVFVEDMGMPMSLDVSSAKADCYTLTVSGREMYHFPICFTGISFVGYDMTEAVVWTIYILASDKNWLEPYQGKYISCRCFSARQQAAAMQISSSVARQYQGAVSEEQIRGEFDKLRGHVSAFVSQAPRFSAQPIEESVFNNFGKGRFANVPLLEIARQLYGTASFEEELEAYCRLVKDSSVYQRYLDDATQQLVETAYSLPIMAVGHLFTELGTLIDEIEPVNPSEFSRLLQEPVQFSLSAPALKACFEKVDQACLLAVRTQLETDFLRSVCEQARTMISREFTAAKRSIMQLSNALSRFCFVRQESFEQSSSAGTLTWKQLSNLMDRDVYSKDVSWNTTSLNDLQIMMSICSPQIWICSQKLKNLSDMENITGTHLTKAAPILDERLVWAIWVDV